MYKDCNKKLFLYATDMVFAGEMLVHSKLKNARLCDSTGKEIKGELNVKQQLQEACGLEQKLSDLQVCYLYLI